MSLRRLWNTLRGVAKPEKLGKEGAGEAARGAVGAPPPHASARVAKADAAVRSAREALLAVRRSDAVATEIDDVLKRPVREVAQEMDFTPQQIRLFGNYAFDGIGTKRDPVKATQLWLAAGMQGDGEALYSLAMCMWRGIALPQREPEKAKAILRSLCRQGHHWAHFALANMLLQEDDKGTKSTTEAFKLYSQAAELGVAPAFLNLANMYERGMGTAKDDAKALEWFSRAAKLGDPEAQVRLAYRLAHGEGVGKDDERAFKMFEEASASGKPAAVYNVGCAYFLGRGVPRDLSRAAEYFHQAAEAGFFPAQMNLGNMYQMGQGVPRVRVAVCLIAPLNNTHLVRMLLQSLDEALFWYNKAAEQNDEALPALESLKERMRMSSSAVDMSSELQAADVAPDGGAAGAGGSTLEASLKEVKGGVLFEQKAPREGAETLDVKLNISNPEEAKDLIEELQVSCRRARRPPASLALTCSSGCRFRVLQPPIGPWRSLRGTSARRKPPYRVPASILPKLVPARARPRRNEERGRVGSVESDNAASTHCKIISRGLAVHVSLLRPLQSLLPRTVSCLSRACCLVLLPLPPHAPHERIAASTAFAIGKITTEFVYYAGTHLVRGRERRRGRPGSPAYVNWLKSPGQPKKHIDRAGGRAAVASWTAGGVRRLFRGF